MGSFCQPLRPGQSYDGQSPSQVDFAELDFVWKICLFSTISALERTKDFQRVIVPVRSGWRYDGQSHLTMVKRRLVRPPAAQRYPNCQIDCAWKKKNLCSMLVSTDEFVKLSNVKSTCLAMLTYCLGAVALLKIVGDLGVCWNHCLRKMLTFGIVCLVTLLTFLHSLHLSTQLNVSTSVISSTLHSFLRTGIVSLTFVLLMFFFLWRLLVLYFSLVAPAIC